MRVQANATAVLPAAANVPLVLPIYKVPFGYHFAARRIQFDLSNVDEATIANAQGLTLTSIAYLCSDTRIQWANPLVATFGGGAAIPGIETWGDEEGPELVGGEVFQIRFYSLFPGPLAGAGLSVKLEGILTDAEG